MPYLRDEPRLTLTPEERLKLLTAKIVGQRVQIAEAYQDCRPAMKYADYAMRGVYFVRRNPVAVTITVAALTRFSWSPLRKLVKWPARLLAAYQLLGRFTNLLPGSAPATRRRRR